MNQQNQFESQIQKNWDRSNLEGTILYRDDTLTSRELSYGNTKIYLLHNACRDLYDRTPKSIDLKRKSSRTFDDDSNPEIARSKDDYFKVLGNRFACMQYQSILLPLEEQKELSIPFFISAINIAKECPQLTLLYNGINAGKTAPGQYLLLSFHQYEPLNNIVVSQKIVDIEGIELFNVKAPVYMICFKFSDQQDTASKLLLALSDYMGYKNFNIFLFANQIFFIPRENIEIPVGFKQHRFGGLEMIGYFIMKSKEALANADVDKLVQGLKQISFSKKNQELLEHTLISNSLLKNRT